MATSKQRLCAPRRISRKSSREGAVPRQTHDEADRPLRKDNQQAACPRARSRPSASSRPSAHSRVRLRAGCAASAPSEVSVQIPAPHRRRVASTMARVHSAPISRREQAADLGRHGLDEQRVEPVALLHIQYRRDSFRLPSTTRQDSHGQRDQTLLVDQSKHSLLELPRVDLASHRGPRSLTTFRCLRP